MINDLWKRFLSWQENKLRPFFRPIAYYFETLPSFAQWKKALSVFPRNEKMLVALLASTTLLSASILGYELYLVNTTLKPASGGAYSEALIGQPRFLNPALAAANDSDRDITELLFSGLMRYNSEGELIPDLAERYEISNEGRQYDFFLRQNVQWHDGHTFTADDVIFTIKTIQNSDYKSPVRANWTGVQAERVNDFEVRFILRNPYPPFLENTAQKIMPLHIWKDIPAGAFPLAYSNLKPQGTGPFRFQALESDANGFIRSLTLLRNEDYYNAPPYLKEITFYFFKSEKEGLEALKRKDVKGMQFISAENLKEAEGKKYVRIIRPTLPRTFSVFFNTAQSEILKDKRIREALLYATDTSRILSNVFHNEGTKLHSPFIPAFLNEEKETPSLYNPETSNALLEKAGWQLKSKVRNQKSETTDGKELEEEVTEEDEIDYRLKIKTETRKEGRKTIKEEIEIPLEITLSTATSPELTKTADILKEQWEKVGFKVNLNILPSKELQEDWIKPRAYQALLFGQVFGKNPDPFIFWHSSQRQDPGLNLTSFASDTMDTLLEEARQNLDDIIRKQKYQKFAEELKNDIPAVFLINPNYLYPVSSEIQGVASEFIVDPSKRFASITDWYIKTKRAWR